MSRLERQFIGLLTEQLRIKKLVYQSENPNEVSFTFRTDVLGKYGTALCRAGIFAKTVVFSVELGIPSPDTACHRCVCDHALMLNRLYDMEKNRFIGRVSFHSGRMLYKLIQLCSKNASLDQVLVRHLFNTMVKEVRRVHEAMEESGLLGRCRHDAASEAASLYGSATT
jgi:hypothetical protein